VIRYTTNVQRVLLLAALAAALLRCGSDTPAKDDDWSEFGPRGDVLEVDPDDIPVAGAEGEAEAGRGGTDGGSAGRGGTAGTSGSTSGTGGNATGGSSLGGASNGGTAGGTAGVAGGGAAGTTNQGGTAGTAGVSGSAGSAGSAGTGSIVSSPAGIEFEQTSTAPGLELVSSNLVEELFDAEAYYSWFAEIENHSSIPACFVDAVISFRDAFGVEIKSFVAYADAAPYQGSLTLTVPCVPPGGSAGIHTIDSGSPLQLDRIRSAVVDFTHLSGTYVPHPDTPILTNTAVTPWIGEGYWAVSGTLTSVGTIYNIGLDVYPRGPTGLLLDRLSDTHLDTLITGQSWDYETLGLEGDRFETFLQSVEFIEGSARVLTPSDANGKTEAALRARRHAFRVERDGRQAELSERRANAEPRE
jgi:hypothetical protein